MLDNSQDFETLVQAQMDAGESRSDAIRFVVHRYPEAHAEYLERVNAEPKQQRAM